MNLHTATKLCLQAFDRLCGDLKTYGKNRDSLENVLDEGRRLRVWAGNLGALAKGHSALDWRLRDASVMRTGILMLLQEIKDLLDSSSSLVSGTTVIPSADDSDIDGDYDDNISLPSDEDLGESDVPLDSGLDNMFESIIESINSLYKLAYRIRNPNQRIKSSRASRYKEISKDTELDLFGNHFAPLDRAHIIDLLASLRLTAEDDVKERGLQSIKFSHKDEVLISRLIESNITRRRQFRYWEKHSKRLAAENYADIPQRHKVAQISGAIVLDEMTQPSHSDRPPALSNTSKSIHTTTEATRYDPQLDTSTLETQSVISTATTARDLEGRVADLPPPPAVAMDGQDFVCPYCFILCPPRHGASRAWRAHILRDLQPYICTYPDCVDGNRLYGSRQAWFDHESMAHRQCWTCRDHPSLNFRSQRCLEMHLKNDHENITSHQARSVFSEISGATFDDDRDKCPFCLVAASTILNMPNHLANHLERVAAFSLPRHIDDHEEVSSGNSDKAIVAISDTLSSHSWQSASINFSDKKNTDSDSGVKSFEDRYEDQIEDVLKHSDQASGAATQDDESHDTIQRASLQSQDDKLQLLAGSDVGTEAENCDDGLQAACWAGEYDIVESLLDQGANINAKGGLYGNALQAACSQGQNSIVQMLLEHGADVNAQGGQYGNALLGASVGGYENIIQTLLKHGANVIYRDASQMTYRGLGPLHWAAKYGQASTVKLLLGAGAAADDQDSDGRTPLSWAVQYEHELLVKFLVDAGTPVDNQDRRGRTPLAWAAEYGRYSVAKLLLSAGAAVDHQDEQGCTPLTIAVKSGYESSAKLLLDAGGTVDHQDRRGRTPLSWAAMCGHESIVTLLLSEGAVMDRKDSDGLTPLSRAAMRGHESIVKLLLSKGAAVESTDVDGLTPLWWAVAWEQQPVIELLVSEGAAVDYKDRQGRTNLSWAARRGHESIVKLLLSVGAALDCRDDDGHTPMWWAAKNRHTSVVELLANSGATADEQAEE